MSFPFCVKNITLCWTYFADKLLSYLRLTVTSITREPARYLLSSFAVRHYQVRHIPVLHFQRPNAVV